MRWVSGLFGGRFCDCSVGANGKREGKGDCGSKDRQSFETQRSGWVGACWEACGICGEFGTRYLLGCGVGAFGKWEHDGTRDTRVYWRV